MSDELSLSEELRRARKARGESLEQVHQRTGIAQAILQGLEDGRFDVVEPVYARLAIDHYATYLGLDGHAFEERLKSENSSTRPPPVVMRTASTAVATLPTPSPVAELLRRQPPSRLAAAAVALVVLLAIVLYLLGGDDPPPARNPTGAVGGAPAAGSRSDAPGVQGVAASTPGARATPAPGTQTAPGSPSTRQAVAADAAAGVTPPATGQGTGATRPGTAVSTGARDAVADADPAQPPPAAPELTAASGEADTGMPVDDATAAPGESASSSGATAAEAQTATASIADGSAPEGTATTGAANAPAAADDEAPAGALTRAGEAPARSRVADDVAGVVEGALELRADALDSTWVQVQWDGVDGIEEIIPGGEVRTWRADRFFMVRAGRAHGVHFRFQGELLGDGRLGDPTKVLRFRATPEGVQLLGPDLEPIGAVAQIQSDTTEGAGQNRP